MTYLETFNEILGQWGYNKNTDYLDWHIGYLEEDENNYIIYIERFDDELDDYIYKTKKWYVPKDKFKNDILEIVNCYNENGYLDSRYYDIYDELDYCIDYYNLD